MKKRTTHKSSPIIYLTTAAFLLLFIALMAVSSEQNKSAELSPKLIKLTQPKLDGPLSLEETLAKRRSIRQFSSREISFEQISQLAWSGQGITEKQRGLRTSPSAGAIYPIKLYFATPKGLFVYHPDGHNLELITTSDLRKELSKAAYGQSCVAQAGCDIIIAGSERKLAARYRDRAKKYMLLEAGHIAQNILLQALSLDLGGVPVGAYDIEAAGKVCRLSKELEALYIIPVGYPAGREEKE